MTTNAGTWAVRPTLDSNASRPMVDAAVAEASALSVTVTVVAVDESGVLKELFRMDGAPLVSVQTALNKAYAAAAVGMPPDDFCAAIEADGASLLATNVTPGRELNCSADAGHSPMPRPAAMISRISSIVRASPPVTG